VTIRVMLVDDHRLIREALRDTLEHEPDLRVVAEAGDGAEALALARSTVPEVVLLDIGLPDINGIELAARLARLPTPPRIVALSAYADKRFVTEMLRAGALAYVSKSAAGTDLVQAIHCVHGGRTFVSPDIASALVEEVRFGAGEAATRLGRREREVLRLIAQGKRSQAIAEAMNVSVATVEVHRRNIMRKLDLHTVAELTTYAIREGIVSI